MSLRRSWHVFLRELRLSPRSPVVFFAIAMLLGRLEFFTLFALILPGFWRR